MRAVNFCGCFNQVSNLPILPTSLEFFLTWQVCGINYIFQYFFYGYYGMYMTKNEDSISSYKVIYRWGRDEWQSWYSWRKGWHLEGPWQAWRVSPCEPMCLTLGWSNPLCQYRLGQEQAEKRLEEKGLGVPWMKNFMWPGNVWCQNGKPTVSWAASKAVWAAGGGIGFCPSASFSQDSTQSYTQLWHLQHKKDVNLL